MKLLTVFLLSTLLMHTPQNIQAPYTATDFWTQWNSTNPRMALFILVTPRADWTGASAVGFTSNTRDMTLPGRPGVTFHSAPGITPTIVEQALGETATMEFSGVYQTGIFERTDVLAGLWTFAEVEVFSACWNDTDLGELVHFRGNIGEFKDYGTYFTAEGRGLIGRLSQDVTVQTQRMCRVRDFGNSRCGVNLAGTITLGGDTLYLTQTLTLTAGGGTDLEFSTVDFDGDPPPVDFFRNGKLVATNGDNQGISREIAKQLADNDGSIQVILKRLFPYPLVEGVTTFTMYAGCARRMEDCRKFNNAANFDGEPYVPGIEAANRIDSGN